MRIKTLTILSIVLIGLAVSGCTGPGEKTSTDQTASPTPTATSVAESTGEIMDSEVLTIESDLAELDYLLNDIEGIQDMNFSELDDLEF
jgi:hypothetical protein